MPCFTEVVTADCPREMIVEGFGGSADGIYYLADQLHDGLPYYENLGKKKCLIINPIMVYRPKKKLLSGSFRFFSLPFA
jgi:hypothetical protein